MRNNYFSPDNNQEEGEQPRRRSIRQIEKGNREEKSFTPPSQEPPQSLRARRYNTVKKSKWMLWVVGAFVLVFVFLLASVFFSNADVLVYPRTETVAADTELDMSATPESEGVLAVESISVSLDASKAVPASGEEFVEERARGEITVYNESDEPQTFIETTRFESSEGRIFRAPEEVNVPAATASGPGTTTIVVVASDVGEEYNVPAGRFTVPGLEDTDLFDEVYAESSAPMEGGFRGTMNVVSDEDERVALRELEQELEPRLVEEVRSTLPQNLLLLEDTVEYSFEPLANRGSGANVEVRLKGTLTAMVVDKSEVGRLLAEEYVAGYNGEEVTLDDSSSLSLSVGEAESTVVDEDEEENEEGTETVSAENSLSVEGRAVIRWVFDEDEFSNDILGARMGDIESILRQYPGIADLEVNLTPFWKRTIPSEPEDVNIEVVLEESPEQITE